MMDTYPYHDRPVGIDIDVGYCIRAMFLIRLLHIKIQATVTVLSLPSADTYILDIGCYGCRHNL